MAKTHTDASPSADEVAAYLKHNPSFLANYPDLAGQLTMPKKDGNVALLMTYRLEVMEQKNQSLEERFNLLVATAKSNQEHMQAMHEFTVKLFDIQSLSSRLDFLFTQLEEQFHVDIAHLFLFHALPAKNHQNNITLLEKGPASLPKLSHFFNQDMPHVGRLGSSVMTQLFDAEQVSRLCSTALIPLGKVGFLALGSQDENKFHPGIGSLFLEMLGDTTYHAIKHHFKNG